MVFAHLVHSQLEPLLEFLCSLPGPTGKPALEFVMTEWMSRQHLFYGQYEGKVRSVCILTVMSSRDICSMEVVGFFFFFFFIDELKRFYFSVRFIKAYCCPLFQAGTFRTTL